MRNRILLAGLLGAVFAVLVFSTSHAEIRSFDRFFTDDTLRIDFYRSGNSQEETVALDRIYQASGWAGSTINLIEPAPGGRHHARLCDAATGELLFLKSFDSIFGEYQSTEGALKGARRTFHESVLIPRPRAKVMFILMSRNRKNLMEKVFETVIDPSDWHILRRPRLEGVKVHEISVSGPSHDRLDVLLVAEGYTRKESRKFTTDARRFVKVFFKEEPYRSRKSLINFRGAYLPSQESGCDEPSHGIYRNTAVGCTFDSLDSERYVLTEDNRSLRDIAGCASYDALIILVNHKRYGGGGIHNLFAVTTSDNQWSDYVFLHELGHSFAGLADEYYTSSTAYDESFYPRGVEPLEPNITALLDPTGLKWMDLVSPGTALPTLWEKEGFEKMDFAWQKKRQEMNGKIAERRRQKAPMEEVAKLEAEAERLSREHAMKVDAYLARCRSYGKVGAFEGAGYMAKGLYRPSIDCIMFSKGAKPFCSVCQEAIAKRIAFYAR